MYAASFCLACDIGADDFLVFLSIIVRKASFTANKEWRIREAGATPVGLCTVILRAYSTAV